MIVWRCDVPYELQLESFEVQSVSNRNLTIDSLKALKLRGETIWSYLFQTKVYETHLLQK